MNQHISRLKTTSGGVWPLRSVPAATSQAAVDDDPAPAVPATFVVGNSAAMREVFEQIRRFAVCDVPVMITGESGTGKELVARAIHDHSHRAGGPYVAINCAAVPASLIASELFGYEKGAFTGANTRKHGQIEHAHGGTLFLDEIGDMPIELQGHLLRFVQEGEIVRVGGRDPIKVDVRIIAATNVRLRDAITAGRLREDLYYRLNVLSLHLPPLRERKGDVEVLATYFIRQIAQELQRPLRGFTPAALAKLQAHNWPGNVRELIATLRRAAVLADGDQITEDDLRLENGHITPHLAERAAERDAPHGHHHRSDPGSLAERQAVMIALEENRFNITKASHALGVSRVTFYRMLRRNNIELRQQVVVPPEDNDSAES